MSTAFRILGALAILAMGAVHLDQYLSVHYQVIPVIGTLFMLNFIGAVAIGIVLILPLGSLLDRLSAGLGTAVNRLAALGGIAMSAAAFAFLLTAEHTTLFGFMEHGYRTAIVVALVAEGMTVVTLGAYLASGRSRQRAAQAAS